MTGHLHSRKLPQKLKKVVFCEGMQKAFANGLDHAESVFFKQDPIRRTLNLLNTTKPNELVGKDFVVVGLSERGVGYGLVVIYQISKFDGAYPAPDKTLRTMARTLYERWICNGCRWPKKLHSDQGPVPFSIMF